ncbi:putative mfs multidrug protein [Mycena sanguinolenta]|uniref:Putative mfs multidrug protein n=1 Tax=Mycena sanguinolenta TaxID=230812 RepID=A0A8H6XTI9_9AGAR|nr:putative mfs multidrug protein [Mycena sanguinolenta]
MPSLAASTIYLFGVTAFLLGVNGLLDPSSFLKQLSAPMDCMPFSAGTSLAATAMGIYYTLAAYQENRMFFIATVPMRSLTAVVFWSYGPAWRPGAIWEGGGAVLTAVALGLEYSRGAGKTKTS